MAPAKSGSRNSLQGKRKMTKTRMGTPAGNRRPVGYAFSKFGRFAALHARRQIVKQRGGKRGFVRRKKTSELDAVFVDAKMLSGHRRGEGLVQKQDGAMTGRLGEAAVHKYFVERLGSGKVKWMNQNNESGLPYDITITNGDVTEYVEVKATSIPNKNWFHITRSELQFAEQKRDFLTIAYVLLSKPDKTSIVFLQNPHKLLRQRDLKLSLIMSMRCMRRALR